jgi:hypothetical protein
MDKIQQMVVQHLAKYYFLTVETVCDFSICLFHSIPFYLSILVSRIFSLILLVLLASHLQIGSDALHKQLMLTKKQGSRCPTPVLSQIIHVNSTTILQSTEKNGVQVMQSTNYTPQSGTWEKCAIFIFICIFIYLWNYSTRVLFVFLDGGGLEGGGLEGDGLLMR